MKRILLSLSVCLLALSPPAWAQWAHKEGAPMPPAEWFLVEPFSKAQWEASNFGPAKDVAAFRALRYGMFVHFGVTCKPENGEISFGAIAHPRFPDTYPAGGVMANGKPPADEWTTWYKDMKLEKFDAHEWVQIAQRAGFKYIVVNTKHMEGFHMWDTEFSDFKITRTPFGRDYLKELADACHAAQMPIGIYYGQRDSYHPDYQPVDTNKATMTDWAHWRLKPGQTSPLGPRHAKYIEYQKNVVRELCTKYGKIDLWWWDAVWYGGMFTAEMWDAENLTRMVRQLQPHIVMNNRCSVPGDFDTPEQRIGSYQDWRPWETCIPISQEWCYSGKPARSRADLVRLLVNTACGDGNLLASWGPHWNGAFDEAQKQRLFEVGDWLKSNGRAIYGTRGGPWIFSAWGGSTHHDKTVWLHIVAWNGDTLRLPALPGRTVESAQLLNGERVECKQAGAMLAVTVPRAGQAAPVTIVELTFDQSVDNLPALAGGEVSPFNDPVTYGQVVSRQAKVKTSSTSEYGLPAGPPALVAEKPVADFAFHTAAETNPWVEIDLGREVSVTGARVLNRTSCGQPGQDRAATLRLSVSLDSKQWQEVWKADRGAPQWEIPVTDLLAGAQVPGRKARYLRLETKPATPTHFHLRQVTVWGKE